MNYDYEENHTPFEKPDETNPEPEARSDADRTAAGTDPVTTPSSADTAPYTEPWREPTYREPYQNSYSPSHYGYVNYDHAHTAVTEPVTKEKKKKHSGFSFGKAVALVLVCVLLSGIVSTAASYFVTNHMIDELDLDEPSTQVVLGSQTGKTPSAADGTLPAKDPMSDITLTASDIYTLACSQVVGVNTAVTTKNAFGQEVSTPVSGSGFIISNDGYIMTNYHVIEYSVDYDYELTVFTYDGTTYPATIIGYEEDNDVAVIKIDAEGLNAVTLGETESMQVGQTVYTVGNPLGELAYTMTSGIVSALDREISTSDNLSINMFQIDAAVNSGNSGGPVYNAAGQVIGIVSAKYASSGVEGLGFAIPISDALEIASQLIEKGYVSGKAQFGIECSDVSAIVAQYYNIPQGVYVHVVKEGSCAQAAGIQVGDVITAIGNTSVTSTEELRATLKNYRAGETENITISRAGATLQLSVTFDETPPSGNKVVKQG